MMKVKMKKKEAVETIKRLLPPSGVRIEDSFYDYAGWFSIKSTNVVYMTSVGYKETIPLEDVPEDILRQVLGLLLFEITE